MWRTAGVALAITSVSTRAASAIDAACAGVHGGHNRVLTRPGTGAFAMTSSWAAHRASTSVMSAMVRRVPATVPVTFDFVPAHRGA